MKPGDRPAANRLSENHLLARFRAIAQSSSTEAVLIGPGDDTAVLSVANHRLLLLTCDMMVEGVHFQRDWARPYQIGWKAVAQNVSDIAAMGGRPAFALASLAVPGGIPPEVPESIAEGLAAAASEYGAALVGGDLVGSTGPIVIDVSLAGWVEKELLLSRRGARPGDAICVTGSLGASAAGLAARQHGLGSDETPELRRVLAAHHEPRPRAAEGPIIAASRRATALMDLSDGIAQDLPRLCAESGVGARIYADRIPTDPACAAVAARLHLDPLALATSGGEDYELLFTCPPDAVQTIADSLSAQAGAAVTAIGDIVAGQGVTLLDSEGRTSDLLPGFDHFAVSEEAAGHGSSAPRTADDGHEEGTRR